MEEFTIFVKNKPGQLAKVCDVLYRNGVNIESLANEGKREDGTIMIITNDAATTRRALTEARIPFEAKEVLVVKVRDRPGELAKLANKIAAENVNIESIYLLENEKFALRVNDMNKVRNALREDVVA